MLKKLSKNPNFTRQALYCYRQHPQQTFGGILNFSNEVTLFRAKRILKLIEVLDVEERLKTDFLDIDFSTIRKENEYLCGDRSFWSAVAYPFSIKRVVRLLLTGRSPKLMKFLAKMQWNKESKYNG
jgi:hypothetical protein